MITSKSVRVSLCRLVQVPSIAALILMSFSSAGMAADSTAPATAAPSTAVPATTAPATPATATSPAPATSGSAVPGFVSNSNTKPCTCMAANPDGTKKHKGGPVRHILKGLTKELGSDLSDMGKDSMFVFSAQDFDPYSSKPGFNPKRPYVLGDAEYVDGSKSQIVKFPDRSLRMYGGFIDGTYACPKTADSNIYDIYYPNGVRGELALSPNGTATIKRPDNTVTRITKTDGGGYKIVNDKLGYMGDINTDQEGLNYELNRSSHASNNLE